jgi:hypothetical protein
VLAQASALSRELRVIGAGAKVAASEQRRQKPDQMQGGCVFAATESWKSRMSSWRGEASGRCSGGGGGGAAAATGMRLLQRIVWQWNHPSARETAALW